MCGRTVISPFNTEKQKNDVFFDEYELELIRVHASSAAKLVSIIDRGVSQLIEILVGVPQVNGNNES